MKIKHDLKIDIGYWLNRLRMEVHQSFEKRLEAYDITIAQWCILLTLFNKQAASISELSEFIETDKASISRVVDKLVAKNLVTHEQGKDRRSGFISLTETATELVPKLIAQAEKNEQQFFGKLTSDELMQLKRILIKVFKTVPSIKLDGWLNERE